MDVTTTSSTDGTILQDNSTTTVYDINMTPDGMAPLMNNSTFENPELATGFLAFYLSMRFLFSGFGIFGNLLTIIAVVRFEKLQNNTNFLICSLATADLISGIVLPLTLMRYVFEDEPLYVPLCLFTQLLGVIIPGLNLYNILGIAIDRFIFISYPLHYHTWITPSRVFTYIGCIWVYLCTLVTAIFLSTHNLIVGGICKYSIFLPKFAAWGIINSQILIVSTITLALYAAIGYIANKQGKAIAAQNKPYDGIETACNQQQKRIAKMMITVMGTYYACWAPMVIGLFILGLLRSTHALYVEHITLLIFCVQYWVNPIIYAWKSEDFRVAVRKLLGLTSSIELHPENIG